MENIDILKQPNILYEILKKNDINDGIAVIDFLNLVRKTIADRPDAKFATTEEFSANIMKIAKEIHELGNYEKIFLVVNFFNFNNEIPYKDVLRIIVWSFCTSIPGSENRLCLVLVNGINDKDKEADDRALFILYNELGIASNSKIRIISNDKFENLDTHYLREVSLNFYRTKYIGETWQCSAIKRIFKGKFKQNSLNTKNQFVVLHPNTNKMVNISQLDRCATSSRYAR